MKTRLSRERSRRILHVSGATDTQKKTGTGGIPGQGEPTASSSQLDSMIVRQVDLEHHERTAMLCQAANVLGSQQFILSRLDKNSCLVYTNGNTGKVDPLLSRYDTSGACAEAGTTDQKTNCARGSVRTTLNVFYQCPFADEFFLHAIQDNLKLYDLSRGPQGVKKSAHSVGINDAGDAPFFLSVFPKNPIRPVNPEHLHQRFAVKAWNINLNKRLVAPRPMTLHYILFCLQKLPNLLSYSLFLSFFW